MSLSGSFHFVAFWPIVAYGKISLTGIPDNETPSSVIRQPVNLYLEFTRPYWAMKFQNKNMSTKLVKNDTKSTSNEMDQCNLTIICYFSST